jgi:hypothetical protein
MSNNPEFVGRLTEMETKEVSLVDIPANQRAFLIVKSGAVGSVYLHSSEDTITAVDFNKEDKIVATWKSDSREEAIEFVKSLDGRRFIVERKDDEFVVIDTQDSSIVKKTDGAEEALREAAIFEIEKRDLPKEAYAYVGDPETKSTWKLKLFESEEDIPDSPSITLTAMAAQALSPKGFRGQRVDLPEGAVSKVKDKVAEAWLKARRNAGQNVSANDLPEILKSEEVVNSKASELISKCANRVEEILKALSECENGEMTGLPITVCHSIRNVQSDLIKAIDPDSKQFIVKSEQVSFEGISKEIQEDLIPVLSEVHRRLDKSALELKDCEVLDDAQINTVKSSVGLLNRVLQSADYGADKIISKSFDSEDFDNRLEVVINKLSSIRLALNSPVEEEGASSSDVSDLIKNAIHNDFDERSSYKKAVDEFCKSTGVFGDSDSLYQVRPNGESFSVFLVSAVEKMAEFDSLEAAEQDAELRNIEVFDRIAKGGRFKVRPEEDKFVVVDTEDDKVVWESEDLVAAMRRAREMNMGNMGEEKPKEEAPSEEAKSSEDQNNDQDLEKTGAAMQRDRLSRLRSVVKLYKEALDELLSGAKSLDKFHKVGKALDQIVRELSTAKKSVNASMGIDEKRDLTGANPNVGSGHQPDESVVGDAADEIAGEGTPSLSELMKAIKEVNEKCDSLVEENKTKEETIKSLRGQVASFKKYRAAPSSMPDDGVTVSKSSNEVSSVAWPRDMAATN